ncbi:MAG: preprotein translocase subunit SecA, partial [Candidatus Absconditabacteria bacterium]|nr:preprotein translocase subunit SecA [Candidatus Absconditabacteria bacterium]
MLNWITTLIGGDYNKKQLQQMRPIVTEINEWFAKYETLSDEEIKAKTPEFKERITKGETLDQILPEAFAIVKQAAKRMVGSEFEVKGEKQTWNMIPYDVQLLGGIILHQGKISEMKTGEGKTLVAAAPVYLNALEGKGVHVVTVNDYLASRDAQWIGYLYQWLGLTVGSVVKGVSLQRRREEYGKDITYVENSELGFDYLRDNLVQTMEKRNLMWRPLNFAIVDEIDSILVDEARTPLIISEAREEATEKYSYYANIVNLLTPCSNKKKVSKGLLNELMKDDGGKEQEEDGDYYIDEKTKTASLSGRGIAKLEELLKVENIYKDLGFEEIHHIENALKAKAVFTRDVDYIVSGGEVLIVDEHTGRTMPGRRFSEGLHQAIEAKEGVPIQRESQTMATITYQNFFKQYTKLAGMTGTAATEAEEFQKIYELEVVIVPTNKDTIRVDKNDKVYFNQQAKWKFVKEYIKFYHEIGQPILIGTADIATSEYMSRILEKDAITHYVLNAKFHEQEAHIVTNAGKYQSVVVATNMAGRGTDIKLEEGLNERLARNYAKWFTEFLKGEKNLVTHLYSKVEYALTLNAIREARELNDEEIKELERTGITRDGITFSVTFNLKKKSAEEYYAHIKFSKMGAAETEERDIHYGLFILGTEKHESRRIDNQLRGRAGRQGDPGVSVFFVALDDLLMRKMGGERI